MVLGKPEIVKNWAGKDQNVYRREVLYQEVWNFPVTEVAKKYAVSDVTIRKICRAMEIPTPPVGYWSKKQAGQELTIPPLPPTQGSCMKFGLRPNDPTESSSFAATARTEHLQGVEEERKRKEEQRLRYNEEISRTKELLNQAEDYEIACKIRAMVAVAEQKGAADAEWAAWAKAKADWYDPTVAARDRYFGIRKHKLCPEQKSFRPI